MQALLNLHLMTNVFFARSGRIPLKKKDDVDIRLLLHNICKQYNKTKIARSSTVSSSIYPRKSILVQKEKELIMVKRMFPIREAMRHAQEWGNFPMGKVKKSEKNERFGKPPIFSKLKQKFTSL